MNVKIGVLTLDIALPECHGLKEKRSVIKPLLNQLRKTFNVSAAEVGALDNPQASKIACAIVSNDYKFCGQVLQKILNWLDNQRFDLMVVNDEIELI